jgi:hypothetical protein
MPLWLLGGMANRLKNLAKVRTTFYIDADLHRKLNIAAVSMIPKRSMSEVVEALIQQFLDADHAGLEKTLPVKSVSRAKVN